MSDTASSAAPTSESSETPNPAPANATTASTFGTSRGSGLARGKRTAHHEPSAGQPASADYAPTAISVVNAEREYKNPFAAETSQAEAPAPQPAPAPAVQITASAAPAPAVETPAPAPAAAAAAPAPAEIPAPARPAPKPELDILPPAETKRAAQSWESDSFRGNGENREPRPRREDRGADRPVFRPERREPRPATERPAPEQASRPQPVRAFEAAPAPKKSGGFFAWLKNLFSGPSETPATAETPHDGRPGRRDDNRDGQDRRHHRRRHRGGRGRYNQNGPRRDGPNGYFRGEGRDGEGRAHDGSQDGRSHEGGGRRRRRGGRGRYRQGGGDQPRPENHGPENT